VTQGHLLCVLDGGHVRRAVRHRSQHHADGKVRLPRATDMQRVVLSKSWIDGKGEHKLQINNEPFTVYV
jgi:hypothetical protein